MEGVTLWLPGLGPDRKPGQLVTDEETEAGAVAGPQPHSGEWERPGLWFAHLPPRGPAVHQPARLFRKPPRFRLDHLPGNAFQMLRPPHEHRGCFCAQDKMVDRSVSGWTNDRKEWAG